MPYSIENKLVVGITSTALFDFSLEHQIYEQEGVAAFQHYQAANRDKIPEPGAALPFIKRLLNLNRIFPEESPVEVVILSRNDPQAGLRMMDAMPHYGLDITRAFFLSGADPYPYMKAVNACLYLSTNREEVRSAVAEGQPAGYVLPCTTTDDDLDTRTTRLSLARYLYCRTAAGVARNEDEPAMLVRVETIGPFSHVEVFDLELAASKRN